MTLRTNRKALDGVSAPPSPSDSKLRKRLPRTPNGPQTQSHWTFTAAALIIRGAGTVSLELASLEVAVLRERGAIRSDRRGLIEIDPARLAAAACECHKAMHLEVEEMFGKHPARSRAEAQQKDRRSPGIKSGGAR